MSSNKQQFSTRANVITRRTYNRPLNEEGTVFETWDQTIERVIGHQQWLWERAKGSVLNDIEQSELAELRQLMVDRKATTSGRTLWLGGTNIAKTREASQFNCSFSFSETVHDVVDQFWLLLQGCGVGFSPIIGTLNGFSKKLDVEVIRSTRTDKGFPDNQERVYENDAGEKICHIKIGDSAEAWAKSAGKILALKTPVSKLVLDFSEIRPGGKRLAGYGWISSGDETISEAFVKICEIMNKRAGQLLTKMDGLDLLNHLGTTLSSRRSAEIALVPMDDPEIDNFILAKKDWWEHDNAHRQQSNNSVVFEKKPTKWELSYIFDRMVEAGGSEPGFVNAQAAKVRAPWFKGGNPCFEILLGNKSFCNLIEVDLGKFLGNHEELYRAMYVMARANYRQTCVNLDDGVLQRTWHELNQFLRLCGVGITGIVKFLDYYDMESANRLQTLRTWAHEGANSMADQLSLPRSKNITTIKPSGSLSKIMDTTEGAHRPLGKYIINNVTFSKHDPIVAVMQAANYKVFEKPFEPESMLVAFPVAYEDVKFTEIGGKFVNIESAIKQLERYKLLMLNYVDHNCSVTISYDVSEIPEMINWLLENWDVYVGVSFIYRNDPTKTAEDLGYAYLPQEVITKEVYEEYFSKLLPVDLDTANSLLEIEDAECATGACPVR